MPNITAKDVSALCNTLAKAQDRIIELEKSASKPILIIVSGGVAEPADDTRTDIHILDLDNLRDQDDNGEFRTSTAAIEWLKAEQPKLYEKNKHRIVNTDEE